MSGTGDFSQQNLAQLLGGAAQMPTMQQQGPPPALQALMNPGISAPPPPPQPSMQQNLSMFGNAAQVPPAMATPDYLQMLMQRPMPAVPPPTTLAGLMPPGNTMTGQPPGQTPPISNLGQVQASLPPPSAQPTNYPPAPPGTFLEWLSNKIREQNNGQMPAPPVNGVGTLPGMPPMDPWGNLIQPPTAPGQGQMPAGPQPQPTPPQIAQYYGIPGMDPLYRGEPTSGLEGGG